MRTAHLSPRHLLSLAAMLSLLTAGQTFAGGVTITIVNINAPGVGFNDPTPVPPVGGNTGTTLGQQRLIAFQHAAGLGPTLDSPVPVFVTAQFIPSPRMCWAVPAPRSCFGTLAAPASIRGPSLPVPGTAPPLPTSGPGQN